MSNANEDIQWLYAVALCRPVLELPLWRCEFRFSNDRYLIAKFIRAATAQDALERVRNWHGGNSTVVVSLDQQPQTQEKPCRRN